ncbi:hypothetical protein CV093_17900 [Oceanobacillus sp. 143]|nr:hypothetical protein CV093_17900 [Oceanobacillus sp. 143]
MVVWVICFLSHKETTPFRATLLLKVIYQHLDHIDKHFSFALKSVKNNHTISEAVALYSVGILFPFMNKAKKWKEKGRKYLEKEAMWQIYDDGSYIQNSMNYHRLMLQDYTWAIRLGELNDEVSLKN